MSDLVLTSKNCKVVQDAGGRECGLVYQGKMAFTDWQKQGELLQGIYEKVFVSLPFLWGDWLNYGEAQYGECYSQALQESGYEIGSLRNAKWVCSQISPKRRNPKLTFGHHQAVAPASPEEQDRWLKDADDNRWTVAELRRAIKGDKIESPIHVDTPLDVWLEGYTGSSRFEEVRDDIPSDIRNVWQAAKRGS